MTPRAGVKPKPVDRLVRILIADDYPAIRKVVRSLLQQHPGFEVCGEAADGAEAIEEALRLKPDVVVLDVTMPVLNGLQAAREINVSLPGTAIVILSAHADKEFVDEAKKIGVRAYVAKTSAAETLTKAVEAAMMEGDLVL